MARHEVSGPLRSATWAVLARREQNRVGALAALDRELHPGGGRIPRRTRAGFSDGGATRRQVYLCPHYGQIMAGFRSQSDRTAAIFSGCQCRSAMAPAGRARGEPQRQPMPISNPAITVTLGTRHLYGTSRGGIRRKSRFLSPCCCSIFGLSRKGMLSQSNALRIGPGQ